MTKHERIEKLEMAQDLINQAIDFISDAVADTSKERSADVYIIAHLDNWANGGNPYDDSIPVLIDIIAEEEN